VKLDAVVPVPRKVFAIGQFYLDVKALLFSTLVSLFVCPIHLSLNLVHFNKASSVVSIVNSKGSVNVSIC
jgi:hypothetical protein